MKCYNFYDLDNQKYPHKLCDPTEPLTFLSDFDF